METTLKLYKHNSFSPTKPYAFPGSGDNHAWLSNYRYSASRMSSAPNITATLEWPTCLDDEWSTNVFVAYRGERYFIKNTPSSSYNNASNMYSHSVELVSERAVLDSVYFINATATTSDSLTHDSEFSFSGDIHELANRLNLSLVESGVGGNLGYHAVVDDGVTSDSKLFSVSNQYISDTLKAAYELYEVPYYFVGKTIHFGNQQSIIGEPFEYGSDKSLLSISKSNSNSKVVTRITGAGSDRNIPYYYPNPTPKGKIYLDTNATDRYAISDVNKFADKIELDEKIEYSYGLVANISSIGVRNEDGDYTLLPHDGMLIPANTTLYEATISIIFTVSDEGLVSFDISAKSSNNPLLTLWFSTWCNNAEVGSGDNVRPAIITANGVDCGELSIGSYILLLHSVFYNNTNNDCRITINVASNEKGRWAYSRNGKIVNIEQCGVSIISGEPQNGDYIIQRQEWRINVKNNLMPSEYRRTLGENKWYNATNDANRGEWYGDVIFENVYDKSHPVEHIHTDDEIYPTITGIVNNSNLPIDIFSEIAFDQYDNDEIYPVGDELEGKYKHPYFFAKLRKTDGEYGFNLFEHAIEGQQMSISFTTGHVGGCTFNIGMDDATGTFNPVQVDENGDLVRDENGDVLCGQGYQGAQPRQPQQQDTINNEVWIALKKENSTMGIIMPSAINNIVPYSVLDEELSGKAPDKFVILGIHLPEAYIIAAEDRLEDTLIEYMAENNSERFTFSLKISSIFLAENPSIYELLNENCKVKIKYDGKIYDMYVDSYTLSARSDSYLPEVTITLSDELKVVESLLKDVIETSNTTKEKLKGIEMGAQTLRVQVLGISSTSSQTLRRIEGVEALLSTVDLESLSERVDNNTKEILAHGEILKAVPVLEDRVSIVENKIKVAIIQ